MTRWWTTIPLLTASASLRARFDDFPKNTGAAGRRIEKHQIWKQNTYRAHYLDKAFPGIFIDELNEAHVTKWFAELDNETGPGGANREMSLLNNMLNKSWGCWLENANPCRAVRLNRNADASAS